ncbi:MAG: META domain-containing protein, partial [Rubripirellula sp.]|nr:META domain-containing protein [Rubripirellula sp.]
MKLFGFFFASVILIHSVQAHDIVLRDQNNAILGVSYPAKWKQVVEQMSVTATSQDGSVWSMIRPLDDIQDEDAGIQKIKAGLGVYLTEIQYGETSKSKQGALILSGTGQAKESGDEVVFTSRLFRSGKRYCGILFVVQADAEKANQKTIAAICESIVVEEEFAKEASKRPATDTNNLFSQPWLVEDINGGGVVDRAQTTIAFSKDGGVSGSTSVNRFRGTATVDGNKISVGPLATTRRAGPPALMDQESTFVKAIETVTSFQIEATGLLVLRNEKGDSVLRLSPM